MRLRYGMRLGRGLWVSGGFGIVVAYGIVWLLAAALATTIMIGFAILCAIGMAIRLSVEYRHFRKQQQDDVALFQQIADRRVKHVEYLGKGRTDPPALWGVYSIEPSTGSPYACYGPHPSTLQKLWMENRCGSVRGLLVLPDKRMAIALLALLQRGVCSVRPNPANAVSGFAPTGMPILRNAQP